MIPLNIARITYLEKLIPKPTYKKFRFRKLSIESIPCRMFGLSPRRFENKQKSFFKKEILFKTTDEVLNKSAEVHVMRNMVWGSLEN